MIKGPHLLGKANSHMDDMPVKSWIQIPNLQTQVVASINRATQTWPLKSCNPYAGDLPTILEPSRFYELGPMKQLKAMMKRDSACSLLFLPWALCTIV